MRKTVVLATVALFAIAGCADDSAVSGVNGATSSTVSEPTPTVDTSTPMEEPEAEPEPEVEDDSALLKTVTITSCKKTEWGAEVKGTILNSASKVADLSAVVEVINSKGDRVDEVYIMESAVKPGQKVKYSSTGLAGAEDIPKSIKCAVLSVDVYEVG